MWKENNPLKVVIFYVYLLVVQTEGKTVDDSENFYHQIVANLT